MGLPKPAIGKALPCNPSPLVPTLCLFGKHPLQDVLVGDTDILVGLKAAVVAGMTYYEAF